MHLGTAPPKSRSRGAGLLGAGARGLPGRAPVLRWLAGGRATEGRRACCNLRCCDGHLTVLLTREMEITRRGIA